MADVLIVIRGGVFQGAISDSSGNRIMVVDYDNENAQGAPERAFDDVVLDAEMFTSLVNAENHT
jgi:hypothetical protein